MVDSSPEIAGLAIDLHKDLIEVPPPLRDLAHVASSSHPDLAGEHRPETVHPCPNALVANVDAALVEKVFDVAKRQWKSDVHRHRNLDDLGRRFEIAEWISRHETILAAPPYPLNRPVLLTMPSIPYSEDGVALGN